ncbi:hypothetical protein B296_00027569 [Ensete ventricosum]|uniref:Uncharacterized protein n=1 Tax=Ensete ventricosum TaxID=4639 RepID=A0A426YCA1_ENSVE|nr:hypothetical protein B296_00027569 [Ensete ventricosum]
MEKGESRMERLPELSVAHAISLTSPRVACRLSSGRATAVVMVGAGEAEEAEREGCCCCWQGLRLRSLLVEKSGWKQRLGRRVEQRQGTCSCYDRERGKELLFIAIYCLSQQRDAISSSGTMALRQSDTVREIEGVAQRRRRLLQRTAKGRRLL